LVNLATPQQQQKPSLFECATAPKSRLSLFAHDCPCDREKGQKVRLPKFIVGSAAAAEKNTERIVVRRARI
jgi:hypothetical protein